MNVEHLVIFVLWLITTGMTGFLIGVVCSMVAEVVSKKRKDPVSLQILMALSMVLLLLVGVGLVVGESVQMGIGPFLLSLAALLLGCWGFVTMEAHSSWTSPGEIAALELMGRFTPNLAALMLWGLRHTGVEKDFYQKSLAVLGREETLKRSWWFRHQMIVHGNISSWRQLLKDGKRGCWKSLQRLTEQNREFAYTLILDAHRNNPAWPEHETRKFATWMIQQPDPQIRKAGLRIAGKL